MIPTVEQILKDLLAGSITMEQALAWLDSHLSMAYDDGHSAAYHTIKAEQSEDAGF